MTNIGRSVVIDGHVTSEEDLLIKGCLRGHLHLREAAITIEEHAHIEADIRCARVLVYGTVHGSISASDRIELRPSAVVNGSLSANRVIIADGARFNGRIDMDRRTIAVRVAHYKSNHDHPHPVPTP